MKKSFALFVLLFLGMILLSSCSKPEDHTEYFNFRVIDESTYIHDDNSLNYLEKDTYMVVSLNKNSKLPETLIVPDEYNGKKVTAIGSNLLDGANIKTLVLPQSIKLVGSNLCGSGCNCPMLEKIICLGYSPFYLGSFAFDQTQLRGGCKIYVPDEVVESYKSFNEGEIDLAEYKDLIFPYSELDEETKKYIEKNTNTITYEEAKEIDPALKYFIDENASKGFEYKSNTDGTYSIVGMGSCTDEDIIIPEFYRGKDVTSIGVSAFYGCSNIKSCTLSKNIRTIENEAFYNCNNLKDITFCTGITSIGEWAFRDCDSVKIFVLPEGLTSIGKNAFYDCDNLISINIPDSTITIGDYAFNYCDKLESVTFGENSQLANIGLAMFSGCASLTSISIPESVTSIGEWAFYQCKNLKEISIPDNVTVIGDLAFTDCENLTTVTFGENSKLKTIGRAFGGCDKLSNIIIPNSVTSICFNSAGFSSITLGSGITVIEFNAFQFCRNLTSITIPSSVVRIEELAFTQNYSLTTIYFEGSLAQWNAISKGNRWDSDFGNYTIYCSDGVISK